MKLQREQLIRHQCGSTRSSGPKKDDIMIIPNRNGGLPTFPVIIEIIRKREEERDERRRVPDQPTIEIPLPVPPQSDIPPVRDDVDRGVVIIQLIRPRA